jgi:hypothetical protein
MKIYGNGWQYLVLVLELRYGGIELQVYALYEDDGRETDELKK